VLVVCDAGSLAVLGDLLRGSGVEVVGAAFTPETALALLRSAQPSVVALDLDALLLDSLQLLPQLVRERCAPVMTFSLQAASSSLLVRAVALGASEVITRRELPAWGERQRHGTPLPRHRPPATPHPEARSARTSQPSAARSELFAIGASTGGTLALTELLKQLPEHSPPILIVQHMLAEFTHDFAERLNAACALDVREAVDGESVQRGRVLIARGGWHMRLARAADAGLCVRLSDEEPVGKHRPSVNVLFQSCAEVIGAAGLGVLLTGMGEDGAAGLLAMRQAGAQTVVQDEASSACFGMPRAAIECGAALHVLSLRDIAKLLAGGAAHARHSQSSKLGPGSAAQ